MSRQHAEALQCRDPGLQAERTALAWNRTGLAVCANALLAFRSGWSHQQVPITLLAFALLIASGAAVFYGARRRWQLLDGQAATAPSAQAIAAATVVALVTCVTAIATITGH